MKGKIVSFRRGGNRYYPLQAIVEVEGAGVGDFHKLVGKKVVWRHPLTGAVFTGRIVRLHGRRGRVIVRFKRQPPGEAVGREVEIV